MKMLRPHRLLPLVLLALAACAPRAPAASPGGMPSTDVILLVVSPGGRVMKHVLLHTMSGTTGVQIEQQLQPYGTGIENVNIIKTKPGELAPTPVNIAWADLSYEPSEPEAP